MRSSSRARSWMYALAAVALLVPGSLAGAEDVLVLTTGRKARGKILEETPEKVRLEVSGGSLWYPRSLIKEIRRDPVATLEPAAPAPTAIDRLEREEYHLLYREGVRVGARVFRVVSRDDSVQFEEELFFPEDGEQPARIVRTVEKSDRGFHPISFQIRETRGEGTNRLVVGDLRDSQLVLTVVEGGRRRILSAPVPHNARFAFGARELFLREVDALKGSYQARVYDPALEEWVAVSYRDGGTKQVRRPGSFEGEPLVDARILVRKRGKTEEREWTDLELRAVMAEIDGESLRSLGSTETAVEWMRSGAGGAPEGVDRAARTRWTDPEAGWSVGKPDPSWSFEPPATSDGPALLSIRNEPLAATVDLFRDPVRRPGVTVEKGAEILQRACRAVAPDFRVTGEGYEGKGDDRYYWLEASATTKGESTRTLARVVVRGDTVYRLLAACPKGWYDICRGDFVRILDSFRASAPE